CDPATRARLKETLSRLASLPSDELHESWNFVKSIFPPDREVSAGIIINSASVELLVPWLSERAADVGRAAEWIAFRAADDGLHRLSLSTLLNEVTSRTIA